jgi:signal transduction histidine kinase
MSAEHRILIADDAASIRELMGLLLLPEGYELAFASNGPEALQKAAEFTPDLILLDVKMPGMDGFEVCRRLRANPLLAEVPVLMITALYDRDSRLQGIEAGADDFIGKPFDESELQARVRAILRLNRYRRLLMERAQREQAEEALAQRVTQLALLNRIGSRIAAVLELDSLLAEAARLVQQFGYSHVLLFTLDREGRELLLRTSAGVSPTDLPPDSRIELGEGVVGWVALHSEKLLINDVSADPRYAAFHLKGNSTRSELTVPLRLGAEVVGVLDVQSRQLNAFDENDVMVMETLAVQIATAIHNARLYAAERATRERLRDLAGYLETAREKERAIIAREIHDEFGQALTALKMDLAWLTKRLPTDSPPLLEKAEAMSELIDAIIHTVRRIATDLRPGVLDHLGLGAAIEWQAQEYSGRAGFDCELLLDDVEIALEPDLVTAVFRIFQETLTNVARHAEATEVRVELAQGPDELVLRVRDNGKGMTEDQASGSKSLGLLGMQERARFWGGDVTFQTAPGQGTTVTVRIPRASVEMEGT